jgi:hypothetical protein
MLNLNNITMREQVSSFNTSFELEVEGITYVVEVWGRVRSSCSGNDLDEPVVVEESVLEEYEVVDMYNSDGGDAGWHAYQVACEYVEENFEDFV